MRTASGGASRVVDGWNDREAVYRSTGAREKDCLYVPSAQGEQLTPFLPACPAGQTHWISADEPFAEVTNPEGQSTQAGWKRLSL